MQRFLFCVSFGLGILLLLWHCELEEIPPAPRTFQSDFYNGPFESVEQQMYQLQFPHALKELERLIKKNNLSSLQQQEAYLQAAFLSLSLEQRFEGWYWIGRFLRAAPDSTRWTSELKAHYYLVVGMGEYQAFRLFSAKSALLKALPLLQKVYTNNHYYVAVALTQLGLISFDIDNTQVLKNEFIKQAEAIFQYNPNLSNFNWEMYLGKSLQAQNDRSSLMSKSAVEQALYEYEKLPFKLPIFHGRCLLAWGNAEKKLQGEVQGGSGHFHSVDSAFQLAAKLIPSNSIRLQECYRDLCILYIQPQFYKKHYQPQFQKLTQLIEAQKRDVFGFPDRIKALCAYIQSNIDFFATSEVKNEVSVQRIIKLYEGFLTKNKNNRYYCRHLDEAYFLLTRAHAYIKNYDEAIDYIKQSTKLYRPEKHSKKYMSIVGVEMDTSEVATWIACGWQAEYQYLGALKLNDSAKIAQLHKALELYQLFDNHFFTSILNANEDALLGFQNEVSELIYPNAVAACYEYHQIKKDDYSLNLALKFIERRKSYLLYRDMLKQNAMQSDSSSLINALQSELNKLHFVLNQSDSKDTQKELWLRYNDVERKLEKARQNKAIDTIAYQNEIKQPSATLKEIQSGLKADQQVIQYIHGKQRIFIVAINKKEYAFAQVDAGNLEHWIKEFLEPLRVSTIPKADQIQKYLRYGHRLYTRLIQPVESVIDSGKTTIIIPDQALHQIPFEALLKSPPSVSTRTDFNKLPYFLSNGPVVYNSSWKIYSEKSKRNLSQITLGPASFWASSDVVKTQEIKAALQKIFGKRLYSFEGSDCAPKSFLQELPQLKGLVHLSVHALSSIYDRFDNKLVFPTKPGEVYGFEISGQSLQQIDLLVLAACESNIGQMGAEGTFSLTRSFSQAGVGAIVSTLWSVDNVATNQILEKMYNHLAQKHALEKALWMAKKEFIAERSFNFPGTWSGLILSK